MTFSNDLEHEFRGHVGTRFCFRLNSKRRPDKDCQLGSNAPDINVEEICVHMIVVWGNFTQFGVCSQSYEMMILIFEEPTDGQYYWRVGADFEDENYEEDKSLSGALSRSQLSSSVRPLLRLVQRLRILWTVPYIMPVVRIDAGTCSQEELGILRLPPQAQSIS